MHNGGFFLEEEIKGAIRRGHLFFTLYTARLFKLFFHWGPIPFVI